MHQFTRHNASGDSLTETLTIVQLQEQFYCEQLDRRLPYGVEVMEQNTGYVGLYDLDGEPIPGNHKWTIAEDVPSDVVEAVSDGWASGNYVVETI